MSNRAFQSARPWGTRWLLSCWLGRRADVSIRASVGDAITDNASRNDAFSVSIRASVGDAMFWFRRPWFGYLCFNPRVRGGRDTPVARRIRRLRRFQSARPWGTRCASIVSCGQFGLRFQSARPWGTR